VVTPRCTLVTVQCTRALQVQGTHSACNHGEPHSQPNHTGPMPTLSSAVDSVPGPASRSTRRPKSQTRSTPWVRLRCALTWSSCDGRHPCSSNPNPTSTWPVRLCGPAQRKTSGALLPARHHPIFPGPGCCPYPASSSPLVPPCSWLSLRHGHSSTPQNPHLRPCPRSGQVPQAHHRCCHVLLRA
jgi:hypothetical protein